MDTIIKLLCFVILLRNISSQNVPMVGVPQICPPGFKCVPRTRCRPNALRSVRDQTRTCDYTKTWRSHICCLQSRVNPGFESKSNGVHTKQGEAWIF
ncbi:hypothetical protein JTE90_001768 [Oedothorax gibbosus]|uniref:Secreted protein n=1 Tax=Oedothorax gibbosus TaxID=931172 RepID=A0AAV6VS95_9ARAC|nr:hypothetical protein JTE90_001768 [Oedothorax gibbosus]